MTTTTPGPFTGLLSENVLLAEENLVVAHKYQQDFNSYTQMLFNELIEYTEVIVAQCQPDINSFTSIENYISRMRREMRTIERAMLAALRLYNSALVCIRNLSAQYLNVNTSKTVKQKQMLLKRLNIHFLEVEKINTDFRQSIFYFPNSFRWQYRIVPYDTNLVPERRGTDAIDCQNFLRLVMMNSGDFINSSANLLRYRNKLNNQLERSTMTNLQKLNSVLRYESPSVLQATGSKRRRVDNQATRNVVFNRNLSPGVSDGNLIPGVSVVPNNVPGTATSAYPRTDTTAATPVQQQPTTLEQPAQYIQLDDDDDDADDDDNDEFEGDNEQIAETGQAAAAAVTTAAPTVSAVTPSLPSSATAQQGQQMVSVAPALNKIIASDFEYDEPMRGEVVEGPSSLAEELEMVDGQTSVVGREGTSRPADKTNLTKVTKRKNKPRRIISDSMITSKGAIDVLMLQK